MAKTSGSLKKRQNGLINKTPKTGFDFMQNYFNAKLGNKDVQKHKNSLIEFMQNTPKSMIDQTITVLSGRIKGGVDKNSSVSVERQNVQIDNTKELISLLKDVSKKKKK